MSVDGDSTVVETSFPPHHTACVPAVWFRGSKAEAICRPLDLGYWEHREHSLKVGGCETKRSGPVWISRSSLHLTATREEGVHVEAREHVDLADERSPYDRTLDQETRSHGLRSLLAESS